MTVVTHRWLSPGNGLREFYVFPAGGAVDLRILSVAALENLVFGVFEFGAS